MQRRQWLFIAAMILLVGLVMVRERAQPPSHQPSYERETNQEAQSNQPKGEARETFWQLTTSNPDTFFAFCVAAFTLVLALSTAGLWVATSRIGKRQSIDMTGLINATTRTAEAAALQVEALRPLHAVSEAQERVMQEQAETMTAELASTQLAATAARESAETATRALMLSQRAWLRVRIVAHRYPSLAFGANGVNWAVP
jgi:hypothetical protein